MYKIEIFNQALEPVDFAPISDTVQIVEDYVTLEQYSINVPKLVEVERGYILRIMEDGKELALGVVVEAEQTTVETRITAAPLLSLLDFETLEPVMKFERQLPYPPVWLNIATNQLMNDGLTNFQYRQTAYINIYDTGAFLVSALAVRCRDYIGSGANDPTYTINDFDVETADRQTTSTNTIDGVSTDIGTLFNPDKTVNRQLKTVNVYEVFTASRTMEGRTFRAYFDFTGTRPRLRIYMRRSPSNTMTIDADAPNIIEKEINIATGAGSANRCNIYLVKSPKSYGSTSLDKRQYYRHPDGTVDQSSSDTITPVISVDLWVDYDNSKTQAENEQYCDDLASSTLAIAEQDSKINITVTRDDMILDFDTMRSLSSATIMHNGRTYNATYTGCKISGALVTYMFGDVRTELTSKLAIEARKKKGDKATELPFEDAWGVAIPPGNALTSHQGLVQISGAGVVSNVTATYGSYIIANITGQGYTSATRANGGSSRVIQADGTIVTQSSATFAITSNDQFVIAYRNGSSQAVLHLTFS